MGLGGLGACGGWRDGWLLRRIWLGAWGGQPVIGYGKGDCRAVGHAGLGLKAGQKLPDFVEHDRNSQQEAEKHKHGNEQGDGFHVRFSSSGLARCGG